MRDTRVSACICMALALCALAAPAATITSVTPSSGPSTGGTLVIVTVEGLLACPFECPPLVGEIVFEGGQSVRATIFSTEVRFITQRHVPGTVQFTLNGGFFGPSPVGTFTFLDANAQSIPTLSEWAMLALAGFLAVIGFIRAGN